MLLIFISCSFIFPFQLLYSHLLSPQPPSESLFFNLHNWLLISIFPPLSGQRITSSQLSLRLQYFGQSLSGGQDLTQDGLADLAVGAKGHVLLLR
jgi:hypothetical protein